MFGVQCTNEKYTQETILTLALKVLGTSPTLTLCHSHSYLHFTALHCTYLLLDFSFFLSITLFCHTCLSFYPSLITPVYHSVSVLWYLSIILSLSCDTCLSFYLCLVIPVYHSISVLWYLSFIVSLSCNTCLSFYLCLVIPVFHSVSVL